MTTATAEPVKRSRKSSGRSELETIVKLQDELDGANAALKQVHGFLSEIQKFSELIYDAKSDLKKLSHREHDLKEELSEVRSDMRGIKDMIDSCNLGMLAVIEPGPSEFLPLFDRMAKADPKTHGKAAADWRERPIGVLRLSPLAANALIDADIIFIGQLQDMILADHDSWWEEIAGLTDAIAAAIADKLADFVSKGGQS